MYVNVKKKSGQCAFLYLSNPNIFTAFAGCTAQSDVGL